MSPSSIPPYLSHLKALRVITIQDVACIRTNTSRRAHPANPTTLPPLRYCPCRSPSSRSTPSSTRRARSRCRRGSRTGAGSLTSTRPCGGNARDRSSGDAKPRHIRRALDGDCVANADGIDAYYFRRGAESIGCVIWQRLVGGCASGSEGVAEDAGPFFYSSVLRALVREGSIFVHLAEGEVLDRG